MDTSKIYISKTYISKTYITMCEQATELQEAWLSRYGDYYLWRYKTGRYGHWRINPAMWGLPGQRRRSSRQNIWLPRQDQLQEMVRGDGEPYWKLHSRFHRSLIAANKRWKGPVWCWPTSTPDIPPGTSMEQLWLAFVMKEKHNKGWTGTEWAEVSRV
tara:strand:- start:358 stop:831 length:474 start_codon:yes stop_codon:yes gene_type:complete